MKTDRLPLPLTRRRFNAIGAAACALLGGCDAGGGRKSGCIQVTRRDGFSVSAASDGRTVWYSAGVYPPPEGTIWLELGSSFAAGAAPGASDPLYANLSGDVAVADAEAVTGRFRFDGGRPIDVSLDHGCRNVLGSYVCRAWVADDNRFAHNLVSATMLRARQVEIEILDKATGRVLQRARHGLEHHAALLERTRDLAIDVGKTARREGCNPVWRSEQRFACYLTSACVAAVGLPDDCWELTAARWLRDAWLARQSGGRREIAAYYRDAPEIVARIHALPDPDGYLKSLYAWHVLPACLAARLGLPRLAHRLYRRMVRTLAREFGVGDPGAPRGA